MQSELLFLLPGLEWAVDFLVTWQGLLWTLWCLMTGIVLGWNWASAPLKRKIAVLQKVIELDSSKKMERILQWEQRNRKLTEELKWKSARILALESDLERAQSKLVWKEQ